jgi:hypothetical protein
MTLGVTRDITKYVDITQSTIDRPIPYSKINFDYSPPVTLTSLKYLNQFSQQFGNLNYSAPDKYDGQSYDVKVDGQRSVLVNIIDENDDTTGLVYGAWLDFDDKIALGSPYMFFNQLVDSSEYPVTSAQYDTYNAPSNSTELSSHSLNFGIEFNEYTGNLNENSLFSRFYQQFIEQSFNLKGRIIKVTAQLPESFILNYSINDVLVINGKEYYINSLSTNLKTGKSEIELIVKTLTYTNSVLT